MTGEGATGTLTLRGPGKSGRAWSAFPGRPKLPTGEAGFQSPGGPPGGGAGENPPGRHPEWLISADESLFSFRLNTLNRAPSDVYLHSLRANAGEGRGAGATRGLGGAGGKLGAASAAGEGRVFPGFAGALSLLSPSSVPSSCTHCLEGQSPLQKALQDLEVPFARGWGWVGEGSEVQAVLCCRGAQFHTPTLIPTPSQSGSSLSSPRPRKLDLEYSRSNVTLLEGYTSCLAGVRDGALDQT